MKTPYILIIFISSTLFFSCEQSKTKADLLVGSWHGELFMDSQQIKKLNKEEDADEMGDVELSGKSDVEYFSTGKYNEEAALNLRLSENNQSISLKFDLRDSGSWSLDEKDNLIITTEEATLIPADEVSKEFLKEVPEFADMIRPLKGETEKSSLVRIDEEFYKIKTSDNIMIDYTRIKE